MQNDFHGEVWVTCPLNSECVGNPIIEVSNLGRVRTTNKLNTKRVIAGSRINGYAILRVKLFRERDPVVEEKYKGQLAMLAEMTKKLKAMKTDGTTTPEEVDAYEKQLLKTRKEVAHERRQYDLSRTVYFQPLVHTLVAKYFCRKPSPNHTIVGHLDFDKLNNKATNLKWMTQEENLQHQRNCPSLQAMRYELNSRVKLTVTKVKMIKKLLNEGKPIRSLAKNFKVTETQIKRIMRGENWKDVEAAV